MLRGKVNRGENESVSAELLKWVWAAGKRLSGLELRRHAEAMSYQNGQSAGSAETSNQPNSR